MRRSSSAPSGVGRNTRSCSSRLRRRAVLCFASVATRRSETAKANFKYFRTDGPETKYVSLRGRRLIWLFIVERIHHAGIVQDAVGSSASDDRRGMVDRDSVQPIDDVSRSFKPIFSSARRIRQVLGRQRWLRWCGFAKLRTKACGFVPRFCWA